MNILFAASEVAPFIKTGGLADVAGSLPNALAAQGHDVRVVLPLYQGMDIAWREKLEFFAHTQVNVAWRTVYCGFFQLSYQGITYYFVDNENYFKRQNLYGYFDDCERFTFFCQSVLALPTMLDWSPDILHANDWQTALLPIYLRERRNYVEQLRHTATLFTIHNIEYQGRYSTSVLHDVLGLDISYFNSGMLEYYGDINLMKGAIETADHVTTVSPSYADELHIPFYAHGLSDVIASRAGSVTGILNGIDLDLYNPATDPILSDHYTKDSLDVGKANCKKALQGALGLTIDPNVPIIACISRLAEHKGFALVLPAIGQIMEQDAQFVVLGTGEHRFEEGFRHAEQYYGGRFSAKLAYSGTLATLIYAGADLFLMPSISEPCGLSQMIAMRYGTLPIVRETGGLRDTVFPYRPETGEGRGFTFANINRDDMVWVLREAVSLYHDNPTAWRTLQLSAMSADFSWNASAQTYTEIYQNIIRNPSLKTGKKRAKAPAKKKK